VGIATGAIVFVAGPDDGGAGPWNTCTVSLLEIVTPGKLFSWPRDASFRFGFTYTDGAMRILRAAMWGHGTTCDITSCATLETEFRANLSPALDMPLDPCSDVTAASVITEATALGLGGGLVRVAVGCANGHTFVPASDPAQAGPGTILMWDELPPLPQLCPVLGIANPRAFGDPPEGEVQGRYVSPIVVTTTCGMYRFP
jgi:hypothetical protein